MPAVERAGAADKHALGSWLEEISATPLGEKSERAIWLQIYDRMRASVEDGQIGFGAQLPGEHQIADAFGVNRITLRRALARLQDEGYLVARKGVGIFVRPRPTRYTVASDQGFLASVDGAVADYSVRTLGIQREAATVMTADKLSISIGSEVIRLDRVRVWLNQPIYRTVKYFAAARFPQFEPAYAESQSVAAVFRAHGVAHFERVETRVSGGFATASDAEALDLTPKTPVLRTAASNVDPDGRPIEYSLGTWPLTTVELVFERP